MQGKARTASRVVLLDPDGRVLLFHGWDPADLERGCWWLTPGGGLEPGEDPRDGAVRELWEETGVRLAPDDLEGPILETVDDFSMDGNAVRQTNRFYLARVAALDVDVSRHTELERRSVGVHRWWTLAELRATTERVYPAGLAELVGAA